MGLGKTAQAGLRPGSVEDLPWEECCILSRKPMCVVVSTNLSLFRESLVMLIRTVTFFVLETGQSQSC